MKLVSLFIIFFLTLSKNLRSIEFQALESEKGIKFWLIEDNSLPLISLSFLFKGGSILDPDGNEGVTNLMTSLLDEGTESFSSSEFKLSMKENGVKLSFSASKEKINGTFQVVR